jgi:hypothetical protein
LEDDDHIRGELMFRVRGEYIHGFPYETFIAPLNPDIPTPVTDRTRLRGISILNDSSYPHTQAFLTSYLNEGSYGYLSLTRGWDGLYAGDVISLNIDYERGDDVVSQIQAHSKT